MHESNAGAGVEQYSPGAGGAFSRWWANFDADKTFAYTTFRKVKLQDRTLGILDLLLKLAIVLYIIFYVMFKNGGYLKIAPPAGTTRLSFLETNYTEAYTSGKLNYLNTICTTPPFNAPPVSHVSGPCAFVPASMFIQPPAVGPFGLVATRVSRGDWITSGCNVTDPTCAYVPVAGRYNTYYPAGVELSTLFIDHNIRSADGYIIRDLSEMSGAMVDCAEKNVMTFDPRKKGEQSAMYISRRAFPINQLFTAASGGTCESISLDGRSNVSPNTPEDKNNTIRYDGAVFIVSITYDNTKYFKVSDVTFTIRVRRLPGTEYKFLNVDPGALVTPTPSQYTLINTHGIMIVIVQTGRVGDFDFTTMIVQLTASLALLAVSAKLTDMLAFWVLPHKMEYRKYMLKVSEDFSDVRDKKKGESLLENEQQLKQMSEA